jgi:serine phosphatase RsbU (regulator of sigma subunit)
MNSISAPILVAEIGVFATPENAPDTTWHVPSVSCEMQSTLVPALSYKGARVEAHGQSVPKGDVGGDLVDLVADGPEITAYVADVSGHGLRAGILMGMIKTAVRYGLLLGQPLTKLLEGINHVLPGVKEPHMFATLAALRFDRTNQVEYVSAGHVPFTPLPAQH